jgi:hypothetical protein
LTEVRYRTHVAALLEEAQEKSAIGTITTIDKRRAAAEVGISHTTFYEWWNADESTKDFKGYLDGYKSATEWKFKVFFSTLLEIPPEDVKVVEVACVDPRYQESAMLAAAAA